MREHAFDAMAGEKNDNGARGVRVDRATSTDEQCTLFASNDRLGAGRGSRRTPPPVGWVTWLGDVARRRTRSHLRIHRPSRAPRHLRLSAFRYVRIVHLRAEGSDVPYVVDKDCESPWQFDLAYAPVAKVLEPALELLAVSRLPYPDADQALAEISRRREDAHGFDASCVLGTASEKVVFTAPAAQISPLVREPGTVVVTTHRVCFAPVSDVRGDCPYRTQPLRSVAAVIRRRHTLRPLGVEIFFSRDDGGVGRESARAQEDVEGEEEEGTFSGASVLLTLRSETEREECVAATLNALRPYRKQTANVPTNNPHQPPDSIPQPCVKNDAVAGSALMEGRVDCLAATTEAWCRGLVSNFDYLLYLNIVAGRSFNDLAQWPVMPWVLRDYSNPTLDLGDPGVYRDLSRPVGALNAERLRVLRERMKQMKDSGVTPFLYGTHYSAPGYVLYWLLRAAPAHHLRLQNGRFDAPDRLFHSIAESWDSVLTSSADVKELTPEFFAHDGDFLRNLRGLALGVRQKDNIALGDVILPRWSSGSPETFLRLHRAALEGPYVSSRLNDWIDLVFGYKQTGPAAEAADNVFHPMTYEGAAAGIATETDPVKLASLEAQINEFGQTPRQLFLEPHPKRHPHAYETYKEEPKEGMKAVSGGGPAERAAELISELLSLFVPRSVLKANGGHQTEKGGVGEACIAGLSSAKEAGDVGRDAGEKGGAESDCGLSVDEDDAGDFGESPLPLPPGVWDKAAAEAMEAAAEAAEAAAAAEAAIVASEIDVGDPEDAGGTESESTAGLRQLWIARNHRVDVRAAGFTRSVARGLKGSRGEGNARVVTVGRNSLVKVFDASDGRQVHSSMVGALGKLPLSCLALLPPLGSDDAAAAIDHIGPLPTILAGSYDNSVYGYNADHGRVLGRLAAHDDAVSVICVPVLDSTRLFTGSWDGCVRLWDITRGAGGRARNAGARGGKTESGVATNDDGARGRDPAGTFGSTLDGVSRGGRPAGWVTAPKGSIGSAANAGGSRDREEPPVGHTSDVEAEVWSICCDPSGRFAVIGADDGECAGWDPRHRHVSWKTPVCPNGRGVAGLALLPCRNRVAAACADGFVRLVDLRMGGEVVSEADMGAGALTCVVANGTRGVLAGGQDGRVMAWNPDAIAKPVIGGPGGQGGGHVRYNKPYAVRNVTPPPDGGVTCMSIAPGGGVMAVGWGDGSVGVYEGW